MMNRVEKKFRELKKFGKKAFIAYITAGDPGINMTKKIVLALEGSGADVIELGIPFSDPLADGPTIQAASHRALLKGANLKKIFALVADLRKVTEIPLVFMTYYNPVLRYGIDDFIMDCRKSGVDGVIVPDLPFEEAGDLIKLSKEHGIATIFLVAPTSTKDRMANIVKRSSGFIYYVSLTGVTGARVKLPPEVMSNIRVIKSVTDKPVAVGFGISTPAQARKVSTVADGVIVGSAIVKIIADNQNNHNALISKVSSFSKKLSKAIHS
jgi:tryptophan synthase alpha chain